MKSQLKISRKSHVEESVGVERKHEALCIAHQSGLFPEEALNNQMDRMTRPFVTSQPLSLTVKMMASSAYDWKSRGGRNGIYVCAQEYVLCLTKTYLANCCSWMPDLSATEINAECPIPSPKETNQPLNANLISWDPFYLEKGRIYPDQNWHIWVHLSCPQQFDQHHTARAHGVFDFLASNLV